jgi:hypothetical protein
MRKGREASVGGPAWIDAHWFQRLLEIAPGTVTWLTLLLPVVLSIFQPVLVAYFIIGFDLYWMVKSFRLSYNLIRAYRRMHESDRIDWNDRLRQLGELSKNVAQVDDKVIGFAKAHSAGLRPWPFGNRAAWNTHRSLMAEQLRLRALAERSSDIMDPENVYHAVVLATYNESMDS